VAATSTKHAEISVPGARGSRLRAVIAPVLTRTRGTFRTGRAAPVTAARHIGCLGLEAGTAAFTGPPLEEELRHDRNQYGSKSS